MQEILINYGYNLATAPTWYKVAWAQHQKVVRGLPDWRTALRFVLIWLRVELQHSYQFSQ